MRGTGRFSYDGYELDRSGRRIVSRYSLGRRRFVEEVRFGTPGGEAGERGPEPAAWESGAVDAAARLVHLLAGVSYFKTAAPPVIDLGDLPTTAEERAFLRTFYVEGLAEFAVRNDLDLSGIEIVGPALDRREPVRLGRAGAGRIERPLVPFGGGIDSIVTAVHLAARRPATSLFVVSRAGDRFEAIERAAAVSGLPIVRASRRIDPAVARPESGFLNGHVPVTGIISAIALTAAVLGGHDAVVMSNERSASAPTLHHEGRAVNHQWSKGFAFESGFRRILDATFAPAPRYFSFLRARSELWVAREFASLEQYRRVFRSCNRAFHLDASRRLDQWCGECDKCCFVDLVLAPYLPADELAAVFGGREPLAAPAMEEKLRVLTGTGAGPRPFECVGDEEECRVAALLAAARPDRAGCAPLQRVAADVRAAGGAALVARHVLEGGPDFVPDDLAVSERRAPAGGALASDRGGRAGGGASMPPAAHRS